MRNSFQAVVIDSDDLISAFKAAISGCSTLSENGFNVNRQIAVRTAMTTNNTKAKAFRPSLQVDNLRLRLSKEN